MLKTPGRVKIEDEEQLPLLEGDDLILLVLQAHVLLAEREELKFLL
jgi:hypothetical protein